MNLFFGLVGRELRLSLRHSGDSLASVLFFVLAASLFPLAVGPAPEVLGRIAPGAIWVCALLAAVLPLDRMFGAELEDGSLDQLLLMGLPAWAVALAKGVGHWLVTGLPLVLVAGPVAVMLRMPEEGSFTLVRGVVPGTAALSLLGMAGAAVVVGARRGGVLLPLLVLPLAAPILIFGLGAVDALTPRPYLLLLAAFFLGALPLCPWAAGTALKSAVE